MLLWGTFRRVLLKLKSAPANTAANTLSHGRFIAGSESFDNLYRSTRRLVNRCRGFVVTRFICLRLGGGYLCSLTRHVRSTWTFRYTYLLLLSNVKELISLLHYLARTSTFSHQLGRKRLLGGGFSYLRGLLVIFFVDALLTDDEPLWEPIEWSLIQNWLMFIFLFAWIAENLISSRYGSYTGRDKRVWFAWYKTFWLLEGYYVLSLGAAALFVIIPFYHELTYTTPFVLSWWDWYSRTFFLKFVSLYTVVLLVSTYLQATLAQAHWKKSLVLITTINIFLAYLVYVHFFITFFAYFTDPNWYCTNRLVDYIQLSHEPSKWSWGNAKRDHFSYHNSKTVFWFKNDGPFASAMLFFNIYFFLALFTLHIYWLTLARRVYATGEVTFTYTTYCISGLRQFFYFFTALYALVLFSYVITYWRLPVEFYWLTDTVSLAQATDLVVRSYVFTSQMLIVNSRTVCFPEYANVVLNQHADLQLTC